MFLYRIGVSELYQYVKDVDVNSADSELTQNIGKTHIGILYYTIHLYIHTYICGISHCEGEALKNIRRSSAADPTGKDIYHTNTIYITHLYTNTMYMNVCIYVCMYVCRW